MTFRKLSDISVTSRKLSDLSMTCRSERTLRSQATERGARSEVRRWVTCQSTACQSHVSYRPATRRSHGSPVSVTRQLRINYHVGSTFAHDPLHRRCKRRYQRFERALLPALKTQKCPANEPCQRAKRALFPAQKPQEIRQHLCP